MSWIDYAFILIIVISVVISMMRGFVREALSLGSWVLSFWLASSFADPLADFLTDYITTPSLRIILSFVALFVVTMLLATAASNLIVDLVERAGLSGTDRSIGFIFGLVRGLVLVVVLVLFLGLTPMPKDNWWHESYFMPYVQGTAEWVRHWMPSGIASKIQY